MGVCDEKYLKVYRLVSAGTGISIGVSAFFVFGMKYHNWNVALWGLLSGIASLLTLRVHIKQYKNLWSTHAYRLKSWMLCGCFIQLAGVCGFAVYLTLGIVEKQGLVIEGNGYFLTMIWCFMTWKWGFGLFYYSRFYKRLYCADDAYTVIPSSKHDSYGS